MSFLYPLGFLALLAVPILIFIYIIKNRYTEQTVASTYLWTLSERFLKRRIPINRITGILNLILQILAVILIALILAHPILSIPNSAKAYCFILDGSGSMNIVQNGETRFEEGKRKIGDIIRDSMSGSTYTLIYAGKTTDTIFESDNNKERVLSILDDLSAAYTATGLTDALGSAQRYFNDYPYAVTYLVTDKNYGETENVNVINVSGAAENYALSEIGYVLKGNETLEISGKVTSYESDATLKVSVYFNGSDEVSQTQDIEVTKLEPKDFVFECREADFASFKVKIEQPDALALDNEEVVFNVKYENISKTLLVSDKPFFVQSILNSSGNTQLEVIATKDYTEQSGYGLYVFDSYTPDSMPKDGAVWLLNPQKNLENSNFSYQAQGNPGVGAFSTSTSTTVRKMLEGTSRREFHLNDYAKLSLSGKFTTLLTCDGNPLLCFGTNSYGNREVVFAFDMHASADLVLSGDIVILMSNMLSYSFPEVIDSTSYFCGDIIEVNMVSGAKGVRIETPQGKSDYPDTTTSVSEYELDEVGVYKIYLIMKDNTERMVNIYSALPVAERQPTVTEDEFIINGTPREGSLTGIIDNLLLIFIILAVIAVADYGVYCYEQYQLR